MCLIICLHMRFLFGVLRCSFPSEGANFRTIHILVIYSTMLRNCKCFFRQVVCFYSVGFAASTKYVVHDVYSTLVSVKELLFLYFCFGYCNFVGFGYGY